MIAAGGLPAPDVFLRLPFFFFLGTTGGGGRSNPAESQSPIGRVVFKDCSASGASHSELCGDGTLSDESRFWRKKGMENLRRDLFD